MSAFEELWGLPTREFEPSDLGQTTESDFEPMETFSQGARKVLADPGVTVEEAASDEASSGSEEVEVEAAEPSAEELAAAEQAAAEKASECLIHYPLRASGVSIAGETYTGD